MQKRFDLNGSLKGPCLQSVDNHNSQYTGRNYEKLSIGLTSASSLINRTMVLHTISEQFQKFHLYWPIWPRLSVIFQDIKAVDKMVWQMAWLNLQFWWCQNYFSHPFHIVHFTILLILPACLDSIGTWMMKPINKKRFELGKQAKSDIYKRRWFDISLGYYLCWSNQP